MLKSKKNAFTLIELVAVLVIMAIIALIATPLVMSIIRKARISADKRSVDAYGRSIELAIAGYLMDTGDFPTSLEQLTVEYSGDEVVCSTTNLNSDSSVYLAGCTVAGRSVGGYTYGEDKTPAPTCEAYSVGDEVTYNNVDYYVIKDSSTSEETVTLLKAELLTVAEVNQYGGVGTASNHVNMYSADETSNYYQTALDLNGYGGMAYYSSPTCGELNDEYITTGCTTDYAASEVKYVVDSWKNANASEATEARLISMEDLSANLGYEFIDNGSAAFWHKTENTPNWVNISDYNYWTMSQYEDRMDSVWTVKGTSIGKADVANCYTVVRPVIVLPKSALN